MTSDMKDVKQWKTNTLVFKKIKDHTMEHTDPIEKYQCPIVDATFPLCTNTDGLWMR